MNQDIIQSDPSIMMGKPVIKGTRITVQSILERFAAGETESQILEAFPRLTQDGIRSALAYSESHLRELLILHINLQRELG